MTRASASHRQLHRVCAPGWRCHYCHAHLFCQTCEPEGGTAEIRKLNGFERRIATRDHVIPLSQGGAQGQANMVPACSTCNKYKGSMSVQEFLRLLQRRVDLLPENTGMPLAQVASVRQEIESDEAIRAVRRERRKNKRRIDEIKRNDWLFYGSP